MATIPPSCHSDSIRVYIRVRPPSAAETSSGVFTPCLSVHTESNTIEINTKPEPKRFQFDHVADEQSTQDAVFEKVGRPITDACLSGFNATILAYGQTGSGKTHTITGEPSKPALRGLMPRVFEYICAEMQRQQQTSGGSVSFSCHASFLEIYQERIFDLLEPTSQALNIREDSKRRGGGVFVENLHDESVSSAAQCLKVLETGLSNRRVGETCMNRESSRSHCVFTLNVQSSTKKNGVTTHRYSRFNMIDLAGSERAKSTGAEGKRLDEAKQINKSLSALGNVIRELAKGTRGKERHVAYRDSKMTFLLKDGIGGNSLCYMIACLSSCGSAFFESLSTLKFAANAKQVKNTAVINEDQTKSIEYLQMENARLLAALDKFRLAPSVSVASPSQYAPFASPSNHGLVTPMRMRNQHKHQDKWALEEEAEQLNYKELLQHSEQREAQWNKHIEILEKQAQNIQQYRQLDKMMIKMKEEHIRKLETKLSNASSLTLNEFDDLRSTRLENECKLLTENYQLHSFEPTIVEQQKQMNLLIDKIEELQQSIASSGSPSCDMDDSLITTLQAPRFQYEHQLQQQLLKINEQYQQIKQELHAMKTATPSKVLSLMNTPQRRQFESMELNKWKLEQNFEAREKKLSHELTAEREMTQHLEEQMHSLNSEVDTLKRERSEALMMKEALQIRNDQEKKRLIEKYENELRLNKECMEQTMHDISAGMERSAIESNQLLTQVSQLQARLALAEQAHKDSQSALYEAEEKYMLLNERNTYTQQQLQQLQKNHENVTQLQHDKDKQYEQDREQWRETDQQQQNRIESLLKELEAANASISTLSHDLSSVRSMNDEYSTRIGNLESQLSDKESELEKLTFSLESLQEDIDTLTCDYNFCSESLQSAQGSVASQSSLLDHQKDTITTLRNQLEDSEEQLCTVRQELNSLIKEHAAIDTQALFNEKEAMEVENKKLQSELSQLNLSLNEMNSVITAHAAAEEQMTRTHTELKESLNSVSNAYKESSQKAQQLEIKYQHAQQELNAAQERIADLENSNEQLNINLQESEANIQQAQQEMSQLQTDHESELNELISEMRRVESEKEQLDVDVKNMSAKLQQLEQQQQQAVVSHQAAMNEWTHKYDSLQQSFNTLSHEHSQLLQQKNDLQSSLSSIMALSEQLKSQQHDDANKSAENAQLTQEKLSMQAQLTDYQQQVRLVEEKYASLQQELKSKEEQFARVFESFEVSKQSRETEIAQLKQDLQVKSQSISSLQEQISRLNEQCDEKDALDAELESLKSYVSSVEARCVESEEAMSRLGNEPAQLLQLQNQIESLTKELEWSMKEKHDWLMEMEKCRLEEETASREADKAAREKRELQEELNTLQEQCNQLIASNQQLSEQNASLVGHHNTKQKIQHHMQMKLENDALKQEKAALDREIRKLRRLHGINPNGTLPSGARGDELSASLSASEAAVHAADHAQHNLQILCQAILACTSSVSMDVKSAVLADITPHTNVDTALNNADALDKSHALTSTSSAMITQCCAIVRALNTKLNSCIQELSTRKQEIQSQANQIQLLKMRQSLHENSRYSHKAQHTTEDNNEQENQSVA